MTALPPFTRHAALATLAMASTLGPVHASPATCTIDPAHTYPRSEADHLGGLSTWHSTRGKVAPDKVADTGSVDIAVDTSGDDFGMDDGKSCDFNLDVVLRIQVEALIDEPGQGKVALASPQH